MLWCLWVDRSSCLCSLFKFIVYNLLSVYVITVSQQFILLNNWKICAVTFFFLICLRALWMANLSCLVLAFCSWVITQYCIKKYSEFTIPVLQTIKENDTQYYSIQQLEVFCFVNYLGWLSIAKAWNVSKRKLSSACRPGGVAWPQRLFQANWLNSK